MAEVLRNRLGVMAETHKRLIWLQDEAPGRGPATDLTLALVAEDTGDGGPVVESIEVLEGETAIVICVATADAQRLARAIVPLLGDLRLDDGL